MKKSVVLLVVAFIFAAVPVLATEHEMLSAGEYVQRCALQSEAIDKKIERLQNEIKKGKKTYSAEEMRKLDEKLKEANFMLDSITRP